MATPLQQDAAKSAQEFVKYLVVLGVGALGFSLTSLASTSKSMLVPRTLLMVSSGMVGASVFLGILAYGTLVSQLYYDKINLEGCPLNWQARGQWVLFFFGIVVLGIAIVLRAMVATPSDCTPLVHPVRPF